MDMLWSFVRLYAELDDCKLEFQNFLCSDLRVLFVATTGFVAIGPFALIRHLVLT